MTETVPYEVTGKDGETEFRQYHGLVLATADNSPGDSGFTLLFAFLTGSNRTRNSIPMTLSGPDNGVSSPAPFI